MSKKIVLPKWLDITLKVIEWSLIIIILFCMLKIFSQRITGQTPSLFGYSTYTVVTDSMKGTYDVGDVVVCKRIKDPIKYQKKTGFKKGDVIAFIAPTGFDNNNLLQGKTVTHRIESEPIYDEENDLWTVSTKGDNNPTIDRVPIPLENIEGVVVSSSKAFSGFIKFISSWYGFLLIIVIPLSAILVWQIIVIIKEKSEMQKKALEDENKKIIEQIENEKNAQIEEIKQKAIEEYMAQNKNEEIDGTNT